MNTERQTHMNEMPPAVPQRFSNRRWSLVLFLAVLVGIAQFGLGQFSAWVLAAPFVVLLFMDLESAWKAGSASQTLASAMASGGVLSQAAAALVFHGVVIGAVMAAASGQRPSTADPFLMTRPAHGGSGCGSGGLCGGGPATAALVKAASPGGCGSGGCGSGAGGCGSGGCGAASTTTSSAPGAKSACGCGSAAKPKVAGALTSAPTGVQAVPLPGAAPTMTNTSVMHPSLPPPTPMTPRPSAALPGVSNQPVAITPQAMAIISAQPQTTLPRSPERGPPSPQQVANPSPAVDKTEATSTPAPALPPAASEAARNP